MTARRKRMLLAGMEGQLAAMNGDGFTGRRWHRVGRSMDALRALVQDDFETTRLAQLQRHVAIMRETAIGQHATWLLLQRGTLARADCIIWQLYLRRRNVTSMAQGAEWPPRSWGISIDGVVSGAAVGAAS